MLRDAANLVAMAHIDVPGVGLFEHHLILPVVILTLAKCKTSEKQSEKMRMPPCVKPFLFWELSHYCPSSASVSNFINAKVAEAEAPIAA